MPQVLHLTPEEVDLPDKRGRYAITLVGCGQKALAHALAFAEAGFRVTCTDVDQSAVKRLSKGTVQLGDRQAEAKFKSFTRKEQLDATSDLKAAVAKADIIVFAINPKLDANRRVDTSEVESVCKQIGSKLQKGSLFVYAGLAGLGIVEGVVKEKLEDTSGFKSGEDFGLAYSQLLDDIQESAVKPTVAADDKYSLNSATIILRAALGKEVIQIPNVKVAELASLFAAVKRDVESALTNELAIFCEAARIDYAEIAFLREENLCKSSVPSIQDESNRDETLLLLESAENLSMKLRIPAIARQVNEEMARHAVNLTQDSLKSSEKTLRRARIALLGAVEPETAAAVLVENLQTKGAKLSRYDPRSANDSSAEESVTLKKTLNETVEGADCIIILSGQEQLSRLNLKKLHALMKLPAALVDLAGTVEPAKAEKEGFIYRGLGKGTWKK